MEFGYIIVILYIVGFLGFLLLLGEWEPPKNKFR